MIKEKYCKIKKNKKFIIWYEIYFILSLYFVLFLKYHRNIQDNGKSYCARKFGMDINKTKDIVAFIFIYTHIYCKNPRCL